MSSCHFLAWVRFVPQHLRWTDCGRCVASVSVLTELPAEFEHRYLSRRLWSARLACEPQGVKRSWALSLFSPHRGQGIWLFLGGIAYAYTRHACLSSNCSINDLEEQLINQSRSERLWGVFKKTLMFSHISQWFSSSFDNLSAIAGVGMVDNSLPLWLISCQKRS